MRQATVPLPIPGSFSIVVGTYDNARAAESAEAALREQRLSPYTIDILVAPDDLQRRLLLGRFATREEAEAAKEKLGPLAATARVIPGAQERLRVILP
jgi:cell division septation protein DedD